MRRSAIFVVPMLLALAVACGDTADTTVTTGTTVPAEPTGPILTIEDARIGMPAGSSAALYFTITNSGDADATLIAISVSVASMTMLHEVVTQDGLSKMSEIDGGVVVPAGGFVTFEPGGMHAMMMGLSELAVGLEADVQFKFAEAETVLATAEVVTLMSLSE